jgi:hypothetical protein
VLLSVCEHTSTCPRCFGMLLTANNTWTVDATFHPGKRLQAGTSDVLRSIHRREMLHLREARCSIRARLIPYMPLSRELSPAHGSSAGRGNRMRVTGNGAHHGLFGSFDTWV